MVLVECVPNFSEGRRLEVIDAILGAMKNASKARIIDARSDPDHNRTVVTLVGDLTDVFDAAFAGIKKAAELIDMDQHSGEHPRIGATDVVPFVPISGITLEECARMATDLAKKVSQELGIPTYLYEAAATRPDRQDLAHVRKGQYEGLKEAIGTDPDRAPDFGPKVLPKAGATVIGAREFLIAYNIYLDTTDVEVAKKIAKSIRQKDGGFSNVKAMGFQTKPYVQVSINLTNFRQTPMHKVMEAVRIEAKKHGVAVISSEIYGMAPEDALLDAAEFYLQLGHGWERDQVIEKKLQALATEEPPLRAMELERFLSELSSSSPTPGGGSASCLSGAMGAALGAMICRLTIGKKGYEEVRPLLERKVVEFDDLRAKLAKAIDLDAEAYNEVIRAFKMPKDTEAQKAARSAKIQEAYKTAANVPLETVEMCRKVVDGLLLVAMKCNKNARSDAAVGLQCAYTGMLGAKMNVEVNLASINDSGYVMQARTRVEELQDGVRKKVDDAMIELQKGTET